MIAAKHKMPAPGPERAMRGALGAADLLSLGATPTFAMMALLTGVVGGTQETLCVTSHEASSLSGMPVMYLLMSAFHAGSWLRLISRGQSGTR